MKKCRLSLAYFRTHFHFRPAILCSSLLLLTIIPLNFENSHRLHLTRVVDLNRFAERITFALMKLFLAVVVYLVIGLILGAGIFLAAAKGSPWVLIVGALVYIVAFGKIGCTSH